MTTTLDLDLPDGRRLRAHCSDADHDAPTVVWHHGTPQSGALLAPVVDAAVRRGFRVVSYGRPSYGGSTPRPGRTVASAAGDVRAVLDAIGVDRAVSVGASGGGPHALACGALLPERTTAVVSIAGLAPLDGFDWSMGMAYDDALRAAVRGREARAAVAEPDGPPPGFVAVDWLALAGEWGALGDDAGPAGQASPDGMVDDDVAYTHPWGFAPAQVHCPVLLVHGGLDAVVPLAHSRRLLELLPDAQLWERPQDGHVSVLRALPVALDWVVDLAPDVRRARTP
ncbi:alpha/beta fold hydrolase [Cellulomonas sp. PhB150]|uniref:alpha/beta fold hydrolase n=1 Tax=Cellulomonas sp. PhB150 TaxID=2485188 RepID=UPI000FB5EAA0|nr:alpha/beta hydrolase [Cellulomonas sp. PhB150]ROS30856.1 pimeloyl-ACP methyl ester carboxylesterase [Cellulomonas sp. PhB150]